jgi:phage terminase large subunit-like protein
VSAGPLVLLHPVQGAFLACDSLFAAFVGGIGSGKSFVLCYDLLKRLKSGRLYMVVAPTYPMLRDATMRTFFGLAEKVGADLTFNRAENRATFTRTGAEVLFRSADNPDTLRGPNLSGVALDEASLCDQRTYDVLIGRLRQSGEQGFFRACFTPKGPLHWTYDVFGTGKPDTALFRARTGENPFNPPGFEQTLAKQYGPAFARQELGGEFVETEGAEWPAAWFPESLWFRQWPHPDRLTLRAISLDPSKGKKADEGDYSAFAAVARDRDGLLWVEADLARRPTSQIVADGVRLAARFEAETGGRLDGFGCEADQFQELLADQFVSVTRAAGVQLPLYKQTTGGVPKEVRLRRLTPYLSTGLFRFRDTPGTRLLVEQLRQFPVGLHDDGPDALEYAIRLAVFLWNGRRKR